MGLQTALDGAVAATIPFMLDRVTFVRVTATVTSGGGHLRAASNTTPTAIPCVLRPAKTGESLIVGEKIIKGTLYMLMIPAQFGTAVDVDTSCTATVAARGVDPARTFQVQWVGRAAGAVIKLLASIEQ